MNRWIIAALAAVVVIGGATFLARADDVVNPADSVCRAGNDIRILLPLAQKANPGSKVKVIEVIDEVAAKGILAAIIKQNGEPPESLVEPLKGVTRVALINIEGSELFTKVFFYDKDGCYITGLNLLAPQVISILREAAIPEAFIKSVDE